MGFTHSVKFPWIEWHILFLSFYHDIKTKQNKKQNDVCFNEKNVLQQMCRDVSSRMIEMPSLLVDVIEINVIAKNIDH